MKIQNIFYRWFWRDQKYELQALYEKIRYGYSRREVWNLNYYTAKFLIPRLKHLIKHRHGYCPYFIDGAKMTNEQWGEILNEMLFAFEFESDDLKQLSLLTKNPEEYKKLRQRAKNGLTLFAEYFRHLWD